MGMEEVAFELGNDVSALESVPTALFCALRGLKDDLGGPDCMEKVVKVAIRMGGDTDTIASMAASIAGAYLGAEEIPEHLYKCCEASKEAEDLGTQIFYLLEERKEP